MDVDRGMWFEALNDAGHTKTNLIVGYIDNEMSISQNVGRWHGHLSKVRIVQNIIGLRRY